MVDFAHVSGLDDDADLHAVLGPDEVVVHAREHEQGRDGRQVAVRVAVAEHDELRAGLDRGVDLVAELGDPFLHRVGSRIRPVQALEGGRQAAAGARVDVLDLGELVVVDHREVEDDLASVLGSGGEQVALGAETELQGGHDLFADGVERRVGHLRELLGEVVEQQARSFESTAIGVSEPIAPSGSAPFFAIGARRIAHLLFGVAEGALATRDRGRSVNDVLALGQVLEVDAAVRRATRRTARSPRARP